MKKIIGWLVMTACLVVTWMYVDPAVAISGALSVSTGSVQVGDKFTVSVNLSAVAAWNVHVVASGPVTGCVINQVDATSDALDTNKTFSTECTTTGEGTATISLSGDATSGVSGETITLSSSKSVTIVAKPEPVVEPTPEPAATQAAPAAAKPAVSAGPQVKAEPVDNRSKNNNVGEILVNDVVVAMSDGRYLAKVSYVTEKAVVAVTPEDAKASVVGSGEYELELGDNEVEIVVTAENGAENRVVLNIKRREYYKLSDLDWILENGDISNAEIIIGDDDALSIAMVKRLQDSGKEIKFSKRTEGDDGAVLEESWVINEVVDDGVVEDGADWLAVAAFIVAGVFMVISVVEGVMLVRGRKSRKSRIK